MTAWIGYAGVAVGVCFAITAAVLAKKGASLQGQLQRARGDRRPGAREFAGSLDLDDVVARVLESSMALEGVDAAVLSLEGDEKGRLVKAAGMSQEEAERLGELGSRFSLPLEGELGALGVLAVYSRSGGDFEAEVGSELDDIARRAVAALDNAFRYREARRLADLDALTGLRNRRYFHETLHRECARGQRYGRRLALLVLDVDDFKAVNEQVGHLAGDAVLAETAARVRAVLRASDIACRVGGDEFGIILPEAGINEATQLYRRVEEAVSSTPLGSIERLTLSGGVAELSETDDAKTFFERADHALFRAKSAGKAKLAEASA
jgi:diguanylate cyclase (GGDEF)-like protein